MKNNKFLDDIKNESNEKEDDNKINCQNDIAELIMKYNKDNQKLYDELLILKNSEFNEVKLN